jgi:hypothetical protein
MSSVEKFKALVIVGDKAACKISELLAASNFEVTAAASASSVRKVKCVKALMDCYTADPDVFLKMWPLILDVTAGGFISEMVVGSLFYLECVASKQDLTITISLWRKRILALGQEGITKAAQKAAAYFVRGGQRVWARGVQDALNVNVRNRLDLIGDARKNGD